MTENQWKLLEHHLDQAPESTRRMYTPAKMELTQNESLGLGNALLCAVENLAFLANSHSDDKQVVQVVGMAQEMMAAMYGRMLGLARAYDKAVTKQTVLEAELASTGK